MKLSLTKVLAVAVLCCAASAVAEPDTFHLGTGRDGALSVTGGRRTINTYARVVAPVAPGDASIMVDSSQGLAAGDLVMVLQTTGMVPLAVAGNARPVDLGADAVGRWELARVARVEGDILGLTEHLLYSYAAGVTQVIRVPEYTTVDLRSGASIVAKPWDGSTGGVIAFLATGTITNEGLIDASGMGFRGGIYVRQNVDCDTSGALAARGARRGEGVDSTDYGHGTGRGNIANGGGGGACMPSGGGGGGNAGPGGQGRQPFGGPRDIGGMGGAKLLYSLVDHLTFGGGGGGGSGRSEQREPGSNGGRGGGAIFIRGGVLAGRGSIAASGEAGVGSDAEGAGGGGAGGSISVRVAGSMSCASIRAAGGQGGNNLLSAISAPGGGGGGGRVLFQAGSTAGCAVGVEAGTAGLASDGNSHDAQPALANDTSLAGTVTRLPGGLSRLGKASVLWPADGSTISTRTPTIIGAAPGGMEVVVYVDGWELGRAVSEDGLYSVAVSSPLLAGVHRVQAATVFQGVQSEKSPPHTFSVGRVVSSASPDEFMPPGSPPSPPSVSLNTVPATNGMYISSGKNLLISGSAEQSSTVRIMLSKTDATRSVFLTVTAGSISGLWSDTVPNPDLTEGSYSLVVTATNNDGTSNPTGLVFWVDSTDPNTPTASSVAGKAVGPGLQVNDARPIIQGTADVGTSVEVNLTGAESQTLTTVADGSGKWSVQPPNDNSLSQGSYTVSVKSTEASGRSKTASTAATFKVDIDAPPAPVITEVGGKGPATNLVIRDDTPDIRGTAEMGSTVTVSVTKDGSTPTTQQVTLGSSVTNWSFAPWGTTLAPGDYTLVVTAKDAAGNTSVPTGLRFTVDTGDPVAPTVSSVAGKTVVSPSTQVQINDQRPILQGAAEAGSSVEVGFNGNASLTLTTVADGSGNWSVQHPSGTTLLGDYTVSVKSTDASGRATTTSTAATFKVDRSAPDAPVITEVGGKGPATNLVISDQTPDIKGNAEPGSTVTVSVTRDGTTTATTHVVPRTPTATDWSITWDSLSPGDYTLVVTATDAAGNTSVPSGLRFTVDTGDPVAPTVSSVAGKAVVSASTEIPINDRRPLIQGTAEAGSSVEVSLTGAESQTLTTVADAGNKWSVQPPSDNPLSDGSYSVTVKSTDASGRATTATGAATFALDTVPLDTTISTDGLPRPLDSATRVTIQFTSSPVKDGVTYECNFDGAATFTTCSGPGAQHVIDPVSEATHTLLVRVRDPFGNVDDTPASFSWRKVGADAFIVSVVSGPSLVTNDTSADFTFSSTRLDVNYECQLDGIGSFSDCTTGSPTTAAASYSGLSNDTHTLKVRAKDGITPSDLDIYTWIVDTNEPSLAAISEPLEGIRLNTRRPVIRGTVPERPGFDRPGEVITVEVSIAGEKSPPLPVSGVTRAWSYAVASDLSEGLQTLSVKVTDDAQNSLDYVSREFFIDFTPPETSTTAGPPTDKPISDTGFSFSFSSNEPVAAYECRIDNADFTTCANPYTGSVTDGAHVLYVRARDIAGNIDPAPEQYRWTVDTVAPNTTVASGPAAYVNSTDASFLFSASEEGVAFECALDGTTFEACPGSPTEDGVWSFAGLAEKQHTLQVRTRDLAGNVDATPASYSWNVDLTAPASPEISSPEEQAEVKSRAALLKGTAEASGSVTVYVNGTKAGDAPVDEQGNWSLTVEFDTGSSGTYELTARTTDRAGNPSGLSAVRTIQVDLGVPSQVVGGGLSCSSAGGAESFLASLGLTGLLALSAGRRRRESLEKRTPH